MVISKKKKKNKNKSSIKILKRPAKLNSAFCKGQAVENGERDARHVAALVFESHTKKEWSQKEWCHKTWRTAMMTL